VAVGYPVALADVNAKAGGLVTSLWDNLDAIRRFKLWLDDSAHNDTYLTNLGFAAGDITVIRNSFADLGGASGLWAVSHGTFAPAGASNYFFNAKALTGTNYTG
jgi:hypothetical protein